MKVLKSGAGFTQAGQDELALLRCVSDLLFFVPPPTCCCHFLFIFSCLFFFFFFCILILIQTMLAPSQHCFCHSLFTINYMFLTKLQNAPPLFVCYSILTSYTVFHHLLLSLSFLHPVVSPNQAGGPTSRHPSSQRIVQLLDEFKLAGVNGIRIFFFLFFVLQSFPGHTFKT